VAAQGSQTLKQILSECWLLGDLRKQMWRRIGNKVRDRADFKTLVSDSEVTRYIPLSTSWQNGPTLAVQGCGTNQKRGPFGIY